MPRKPCKRAVRAIATADRAPCGPPTLPSPCRTQSHNPPSVCANQPDCTACTADDGEESTFQGRLCRSECLFASDKRLRTHSPRPRHRLLNTAPSRVLAQPRSLAVLANSLWPRCAQHTGNHKRPHAPIHSPTPAPPHKEGVSQCPVALHSPTTSASIQSSRPDAPLPLPRPFAACHIPKNMCPHPDAPAAPNHSRRMFQQAPAPAPPKAPPGALAHPCLATPVAIVGGVWAHVLGQPPIPSVKLVVVVAYNLRSKTTSQAHDKSPCSRPCIEQACIPRPRALVHLHMPTHTHGVHQRARLCCTHITGKAQEFIQSVSTSGRLVAAKHPKE
jgi:hypothetical protein